MRCWHEVVYLTNHWSIRPWPLKHHGEKYAVLRVYIDDSDWSKILSRYCLIGVLYNLPFISLHISTTFILASFSRRRKYILRYALKRPYLHRHIWWGDRGGGCPPWNSRLTLIRAKKGGLLGQQTFLWCLSGSLGHPLPPLPPLATASKYVYDCCCLSVYSSRTQLLLEDILNRCYCV